MKILKLAVLTALLTLVAPMAFATCPTAPSGPYYLTPLSWYDYTPSTSCIVATGSASAITGCGGNPGWSTGSTTATLTYTFTVNQSGISIWSAGVRLRFVDPTNSTGNYVELKAIVTHNGVPTETLLYTLDGTGSDVSCSRKFDYFNAAYGDTVQIVINSRKPSSTATIEVEDLEIAGYF